VPLRRRDFLSTALLLPALARQTSEARLIGTVPLVAPGPNAPPFGRLLGAGLDARLFTDLSTLTAPRTSHVAPRTSTDQFFVRTAAPKALAAADVWSLQVGGLVQSPAALTLRDLDPLATASGRYLLECSGNSDPSNFGLISTADWDGVPLAALLDRAAPSAASYRIRISGIDDPGPSRTSVPGASWIFSRDELQRAMLAIRMNGAPLTRDHGFPVRLIVPGWYGCACVKWVDRIDLVADDAPATTQMREFAARTHQPFEPREIASSLRAGTPLRARDFIPAVIDTAAMPVRVEQWVAGGRVEYRIAGLIWGGSTPTSALSIRFKSNQPWVRVDDCPLPASTLTWSLWSHTWRPAAPGRYQIVLKIDDPTIRTRRLDIFFYVREIEIDEV